MDRPFDRFVMLADMRTGSNFLEANLNALDGVTCHGEAFNPHFIGQKDRLEHLGISIAERDDDPFALIRAMEAETPGLSGFRFFHDHDPRVLAALLADRRCAKIVLTRNPIESYVSLKIAQATGQWKLGNAHSRREAQVRFDADEFTQHLEQVQAFQVEILHALQCSGQTAFYIDYEDIGDLEVLNGLATFLGVAARLDSVANSVKKQNPESIEQKVVNPAQMEAALARVDRFNLSRTPNFEPRRGPVVPSYIAARGAPLLYLPVRGGPEAQVTSWMALLAAAGAEPGLIQGFTRKTLRDWMLRAEGLRSFTVLRHPLARAHAAFCDRILAEGAPDARQALERTYKLDLPPPGRIRRQPVEEHRAAFLGFLRFLRGNLAGQTGIRIDPAWASQAAVVQGFSQLVPPDAVLREDRLAEGLGWLAAQTGASATYAAAPELPPPPEPVVPHSLADMYGPDLEAAARDAYGRDYQLFGFGDWRPT